MPEVTIKIAERPFKVACPDGEESQLEAARAILNAEAQVLVAHVGRMPEAQMLLMSGLAAFVHKHVHRRKEQFFFIST